MIPGEIWTHNLSKRAAADLHLRLHGHWDRRSNSTNLKSSSKFELWNYFQLLTMEMTDILNADCLSYKTKTAQKILWQRLALFKWPVKVGSSSLFQPEGGGRSNFRNIVFLLPEAMDSVQNICHICWHKQLSAIFKVKFVTILSHITQAWEVSDIHMVLCSPEERMLMTKIK